MHGEHHPLTEDFPEKREQLRQLLIGFRIRPTQTLAPSRCRNNKWRMELTPARFVYGLAP
jgi:hypothetical protein